MGEPRDILGLVRALNAQGIDEGDGVAEEDAAGTPRG